MADMMTYNEWIAWYYEYNEDEVVVNYDSQDTKEMYQEDLGGL